MIKLIENLADRALSLFVPETDARDIHRRGCRGIQGRSATTRD
jgi:hypothetical protein